MNDTPEQEIERLLERLDDAETLEFETALAHLDQVVEVMESDQLSLEHSLAMFEAGVRLTRHCRALLDQAERRVTELTDEGEIEFDSRDE